MEAQDIHCYVRSAARGRIGKVFEVPFWPRIPEEAPINLQSLRAKAVTRLVTPTRHAEALAEAEAKRRRTFRSNIFLRAPKDYGLAGHRRFEANVLQAARNFC